jgi:hypothetical protein
MTFLAPGVGAQGGDVAAVRNGLDARCGLVINVSGRCFTPRARRLRPRQPRPSTCATDERRRKRPQGALLHAAELQPMTWCVGVSPSLVLEWRVVRLGADNGIRCLGCNRRLLLERRILDKRLKSFVSRGEPLDPEKERLLFGEKEEEA